MTISNRQKQNTTSENSFENQIMYKSNETSEKGKLDHITEHKIIARCRKTTRCKIYIYIYVYIYKKH